jgi:hypothetical protein
MLHFAASCSPEGSYSMSKWSMVSKLIMDRINQIAYALTVEKECLIEVYNMFIMNIIFISIHAQCTNTIQW